MLHRRWLKAGRFDRRFARSRWACIDAAVRLLQVQFEMDTETQPGGRLFKERWMLARCIPDFLLGDMILCLELSSLNSSADEVDLGVVIPTEQILEILRMSRKIWQTNHKESGDASRAFKIISRMLSISTGDHHSAGSGEENDSPPPQRPPSIQPLACRGKTLAAHSSERSMLMAPEDELSFSTPAPAYDYSGAPPMA